MTVLHHQIKEPDTILDNIPSTDEVFDKTAMNKNIKKCQKKNMEI
jgi:hypothetical protein